ncbi:pectinesterase inhibitor-like [Quillaja saponaria]|uniref:Pectinesterase inhibitor-like n=1 Tax=Quillaja saponaria TaxID=32244 RepID=A0AAD7QAC1_QUISA|nr:pectinesterase inhibitor-like [Quillaja saponaria]
MTAHVVSLPRFFNHFPFKGVQAPALAPSILTTIGTTLPKQETLVSSQSHQPTSILASSESQQSSAFAKRSSRKKVASAAKSNPELTKICSVTKDPAFCARTALTYLKGIINPANVVKAEIEACTIQATKVVQKIASVPTSSSGIANAINDCKSSYESILDSLKTAKEAIDGPNVVPGTVTTRLSATISDFDTCDEGFVEMKVPSPLQKFRARTLVRKLIDSSLVLGNKYSL